jgi:hypothetical protein
MLSIFPSTDKLLGVYPHFTARLYGSNHRYSTASCHTPVPLIPFRAASASQRITIVVTKTPIPVATNPHFPRMQQGAHPTYAPSIIHSGPVYLHARWRIRTLPWGCYRRDFGGCPPSPRALDERSGCGRGGWRSLSTRIPGHDPIPATVLQRLAPP